MLTEELAQALGSVGTIAGIAADHDTLEARSAAILAELKSLIPFDAAELASINPISGETVGITNTGYETAVLEGLRSAPFIELMYLLDLPDTGRPIRMKDLPGDPLDNWAVSDLLLPAGYAEGMTMALRSPDGRFTGVLNLSTTSRDHPSDLARDVVAKLCTVLGSLVDPMRSGRWLAMLLGAESMAVGLDNQGCTVPLPGIAGHSLLTDGTDLVEVAQGAAGMGTWNSFVWPDDETWYRVRVVPCKDEQPITSVISMDTFDIGPLTRRELEVITLAADGLSNVEISNALVISSRTVGTHIEHILGKLSAPNRAAAVAYALREGLIMGKVERYDLPRS